MKIVLKLYLDGGQIIELDGVESFEMNGDAIAIKQTNARNKLAMIRPSHVIAAVQEVKPNK